MSLYKGHVAPLNRHTIQTPTTSPSESTLLSHSSSIYMWCSEFRPAEMLGRIYLDGANRVKYWAIQIELPQMIGSGLYAYKRLMEQNEHLRLTGNHDLSCVSVLQCAIPSFSAWSFGDVHLTSELEFGNLWIWKSPQDVLKFSLQNGILGPWIRYRSQDYISS